jgi:hypothetical protein
MVPTWADEGEPAWINPGSLSPRRAARANWADHFVFWTSLSTAPPMMDDGAGFSSHKAGLWRTEIFKSR